MRDGARLYDRAMLNLSADPRTADQQMRAIIFYLTTFGHIDGEFDLSEKTFVRQYIEQLVAHHVHQGAEAFYLIATPPGKPLYDSLGFTTVEEFPIWVAGESEQFGEAEHPHAQ